MIIGIASRTDQIGYYDRKGSYGIQLTKIVACATLKTLKYINQTF